MGSLSTKIPDAIDTAPTRVLVELARHRGPSARDQFGGAARCPRDQVGLITEGHAESTPR